MVFRVYNLKIYNYNIISSIFKDVRKKNIEKRQMKISLLLKLQSFN